MSILVVQRLFGTTTFWIFIAFSDLTILVPLKLRSEFLFSSWYVYTLRVFEIGIPSRIVKKWKRYVSAGEYMFYFIPSPSTYQMEHLHKSF